MNEEILTPSFLLDLVILNEEEMCLHPGSFQIEEEKKRRTEMAIPFPVAVIPVDGEGIAGIYCPICGRCYEEASLRLEKYIEEENYEIYL